MPPVQKPDPEEQTRETLHRMVNASLASIHFRPDGTIIWANENFLQTMGYALPEVEGKHHRMFVDDAYAQSPDYKQFWHRLAGGETFSDRFRRVNRDGKDVWIQATYSAVRDDQGVVERVIKIASDDTTRQTALSHIQHALAMLEHGDLTQRIATAAFPDDVAELAGHLNRAVGQITDLIGNV
ncbi:MAG: PAS domain-containing protein [Pseudomonadota bacterium]